MLFATPGPRLPVTPAQLIKPGIASCIVGKWAYFFKGDVIGWLFMHTLLLVILYSQDGATTSAEDRLLVIGMYT